MLLGIVVETLSLYVGKTTTLRSNEVTDMCVLQYHNIFLVTALLPHDFTVDFYSQDVLPELLHGSVLFVTMALVTSLLPHYTSISDN